MVDEITKSYLVKELDLDGGMGVLLSWRSGFGMASNSLVGIEARDEGIAMVRIDTEPSGLVLRHSEFLAAATGISPESVLAERVAAEGLGRLPCNWVLCPRQYNLLLLEAPPVRPEEMREALRWQIKDLVNFPVDQAVLDVFDLPEDGSRGRQMVYAVAVQRERIEALVAQSRAARLKIKCIDIGELALRNIASRLPQDERGLAIVRIQPGRGSLVLIRRGQLYLSRQFELPYQGGQHEALPESNLVLEIQRSLDYYERQMAQEPPARLLLCGDNIRPDKITDSLRNSLSLTLDYLHLSELFSTSAVVDESLLQLCLGAIGTALGGERA